MAASRLLVISSFLFVRPAFESSSPKGWCSIWPDPSACGPILAPACGATLRPTPGPGCFEK